MAATAPRPGAAARAEVDELVTQFKLDGQVYTIRPNDISAKLSNDLRRSTSLGALQLLAAAEQNIDLDIIAGLVFIARKQAGENVSYDRIAERITVETLETFEPVEVEDEGEPDPLDDSPER